MKGETVFEKMAARCETAFLAKTPLIYLCTNEIETVNELVESDRLVTRLIWVSDRNKGEAGEYYYRPFRKGDAPGEIVNLYAGDAYSKRKKDSKGGDFPQITILHMQSAPAESQFSSLVDYVKEYISEPDDNSALRSSAVILYGRRMVLPDSLAPYAEIIDVDFPEEEEIADIAREMMGLYSLPPYADERDFADLITLLQGFSCVQIRALMKRILSADEKDGFNCIYHMGIVQKVIQRAKEQSLKRGQVLELVKASANKDEIGGMDRLMDWLDGQKQSILHAGALQQGFGIECPKGVLLCGVPGCGKSLAAEALGAKLGVPLLKMDVGRLMGRYVGESEHNMLLALKQAEAMSPCILWIDELDKGFSGAAGSGSEDSGVFKRMFGSLLTWMQNNDKPCFIFATANNIAGMPKEFFRSGRFDALFSMFMPTFEECVDILRKRMEKAASKVQPVGSALFREACYDDACLEAVVASFGARFVTGADIQKLVNMSLTRIYRLSDGKKDKEITPEQWRQAIRAVMEETTVYGDGTENLDSIAVCYIRLIRNNFIPAGRKVLFRQDEYRVDYGENGALTVTLAEKREDAAAGWSPYDKAMYRALRERIEQLAPLIERRERERLVI